MLQTAQLRVYTVTMKPKKHAVSLVVKDSNNNFLVVKRPDDPNDDLCGVWGFPAVTLADGESEADGVIAGDAGKASDVLKYHGTVTGTLGQTSLFMTQLHSGKYPSMIITECSVERLSSPDEKVLGDNIHVSVDFKISFYVSSTKGA